jgi:DNA-directed RNA polymerase specialized sigma24 family protein
MIFLLYIWRRYVKNTPPLPPAHNINNALLSPKWLALCKKIAGRTMLGEDLYHHCLIKMQERNLADHPNIEGYFYLVIITEWRDPHKEFRKLYDTSTSELHDVSEDEQHDRSEVAEKIFDSLPDEERALLAAVMKHGSCEAVAKHYDIPARTVRYNLTKIQNKCRTLSKSY